METLQHGIEARVDVMMQEIMAMVRKVAVNAVTSGLGRAANRGGQKPPREMQRAGERKKAGPKRSKAEISELRERLYSAMCKQPGETVAYLAGQLSVSTHALTLPARQLCEQERARKVGERNHTRYFPMAEAASVAPS